MLNSLHFMRFLKILFNLLEIPTYIIIFIYILRIKLLLLDEMSDFNLILNITIVIILPYLPYFEINYLSFKIVF